MNRMMRKDLPARPADRIEEYIYTVRGQRVILDADLAALYGVTTKRLNEQVKRNAERFPDDFAFQLTPQESTNLRSQIATSSLSGNRSQIATGSYGGRRYLPYAFTEHGAIMAANVLNSPRAVQMSVFVVRAFVRMRAALTDNGPLARKLAVLEEELKDRLNLQDAVIVDILRRFMNIIDPPALPVPPKKGIGFHVKESSARYKVRGNRARR
ncbi:MAG TPA: ORF6N domain-containing protein [Verrucomicrobiae bacterium]|nr:ORF6N domain-containing protein [Verrucomicrobiae bacterium]